MSGDPEQLLSPEDSARFLSFSFSSFQRHARPYLPVVKLSRQRIAFRRGDLIAWRDDRTEQPKAKES